MKVTAIKTRKFLPPEDNLWELLSNIKNLKENSVVAVTSKVVSIAEGRCIPSSAITKDELAIKEADKYLPRELSPQGGVLHTIKNNMLIASAGVDESNGASFYILWPKDPQQSAKRIWRFLRKKFNVKNLGVVITDSRLVPLRRGVVGVAIGYFGFKVLKDYRGTVDLFGREFVMETSNMPDSLAATAVLEMGEGAESKPIAVISDVLDLEFTTKNKDNSLDIDEKEDMFYPLLSAAKWEKGGGGR